MGVSSSGIHSAEQLVHLIRSVAHHVLGAVHIALGGGGILMPQRLLHCLDIHSISQQGRCTAVSEIMEAGFYVGQDSRLAAPLIHEPFTHGELGVLMPKGSEDLLSYVNDFLEKETVSGRIDELADEYIYRFTEPEELPNAA